MPLRRTPIPRAVRQAIDLGVGERILAGAQLHDDRWVIATTYALWELSTSGDVSGQRSWSDVDRATYDPEAHVITVWWTDTRDSHALTLASPQRTAFPQALRERVQWSVVLSETVRLPNKKSVRVAVRRDRDDALFSQVVADSDIHLNDPDIAREVDAAESRLRIACGLGR